MTTKMGIALDLLIQEDFPDEAEEIRALLAGQKWIADPDNAMTVAKVRDRVAEVRRTIETSGDDESAHMQAEELLADVLWAIADGWCPEPAACAAEALKVHEIEYERWYS